MLPVQELYPKKVSKIIGKSIWKLKPWFAGTVFHKTVLEVLEKSESKIFEWKSPRSDRFWEIKVFPSDEGVAASYQRYYRGQNS